MLVHESNEIVVRSLFLKLKCFQDINFKSPGNSQSICLIQVYNKTKPCQLRADLGSLSKIQYCRSYTKIWILNVWPLINTHSLSECSLSALCEYPTFPKFLSPGKIIWFVWSPILVSFASGKIVLFYDFTFIFWVSK